MMLLKSHGYIGSQGLREQAVWANDIRSEYRQSELSDVGILKLDECYTLPRR